MAEELKKSRCNLTNEELINKAQKWVYKLAASGGKDWCLRVPVDFNNDPDILFTELCNRLRVAHPSPLPAESGEQEAEKDRFAIAFSCWAMFDPQAKAYRDAGISAGGLLEKYKSRPYISNDTSQQ